MSTNTELTESLFLDLGILHPGRRPYAREVFKLYDIDLLPHASEDTLIAEIFDWSGRAYRSTGDNLIGLIAPADRIEPLKNGLKSIPLANASVPDFEFSKEEVIDLGFSLPFLFNIKFSGKVSDAKTLSVKVNSLKKSRLTNIDQPGIEIKQLLLKFAEDNTKEYRKKIKNDYIAEALFFADSVEIELEKDAGVDIDVSFDVSDVNVTANADTDTKKHYVLKYTGGHNIPFGATFKKGKDLFEH